LLAEDRPARSHRAASIKTTVRLNRLRKNATKRGKSFLQGLKPVESTQFTSALKHRPPEEKDSFRSLFSHRGTKRYL
jgi:hypothetical protein